MDSVEVGKVAEARAWLLEALADGQPHLAGDLQARAREAGIVTRTLRHAAGQLHIQVEPVHTPGKRGFAGWQWTLPQREGAR